MVLRTPNIMMLQLHAKFLKTAVMYNVVVFIVFTCAYFLLDFNTHFTSAHPVTTKGKLYFSVMNHTAVGANDIVPITDVARVVVGLQVLFAWMQVLLVFLA